MTVVKTHRHGKRIVGKGGVVRGQPGGPDETISLSELRLRELMEKSHDSDATVILTQIDKFKRKREKQKV